MNKAELVRQVAAKTGMTASTVEAVMNAAFDVVADAVVEGEEVTLPGLGKIGTKFRAGRTGRNPKTGEAVVISEKRVPVFRVSSVLKGRVA